MKLSVRMYVSLKDSTLRRYWLDMLTSSAFRQEIRRIDELRDLTVENPATLEDAFESVKNVFRTGQPTAAILLSDMLIEPESDWRPEWRQTSALKEFAKEFAHDPYVSIAASEHSESIPDVDLVLSPTCDLRTWLSGLQILVKRLDYFMPRPARPGQERPTASLRPLRSQDELRTALKLRCSVYRIMGYLDKDFLETKSRLELNWCDTFSRQYGLFLEQQGPSTLIGTFRLILTKTTDLVESGWCTRISQSHRGLKRLLAKQRNEMGMFKLPIFHTLGLNDEMQALACSEWPFAELSRVIIAPQWRGFGFSSDLIDHSIREARRLTVAKLFLECLQMHSGIYEKRGFESIRQRGEVLGIGKTMIGMKLDLRAADSHNG